MKIFYQIRPVSWGFIFHTILLYQRLNAHLKFGILAITTLHLPSAPPLDAVAPATGILHSPTEQRIYLQNCMAAHAWPAAFASQGELASQWKVWMRALCLLSAGSSSSRQSPSSWAPQRSHSKPSPTAREEVTVWGHGAQMNTRLENRLRRKESYWDCQLGHLGTQPWAAEQASWETSVGRLGNWLFYSWAFSMASWATVTQLMQYRITVQLVLCYILQY